MFRKSLLFAAIFAVGISFAVLASSVTSYAQSSVYSCDSLKVLSTGKNTISADLVYTAKHGAGMQMTSYDFGDGKIIGTNETKVSHTYNQPGTYTVSAKMRIIIDNKRTINDVTSPSCQTTIVIGETDQVSTTVVNSARNTQNSTESSPVKEVATTQQEQDAIAVSELPKTGPSEQTLGYIGLALGVFLLVTYIRQKQKAAKY